MQPYMIDLGAGGVASMIVSVLLAAAAIGKAAARCWSTPETSPRSRCSSAAPVSSFDRSRMSMTLSSCRAKRGS